MGATDSTGISLGKGQTPVETAVWCAFCCRILQKNLPPDYIAKQQLEFHSLNKYMEGLFNIMEQTDNILELVFERIVKPNKEKLLLPSGKQ